MAPWGVLLFKIISPSFRLQPQTGRSDTQTPTAATYLQSLKLSPQCSHGLVTGCEFFPPAFLLIGAHVGCFSFLPLATNCSEFSSEVSIIHPDSQLIPPPLPSHSCQVSNPHPLHPLLPDLKGRKSYKVGLTSDQITGHEWELKLCWALPLFTVQQDLLMADKQVAVYMVTDWT